MNQKINFNGKSYDSINDMPPDVRQAYQQVMGIFADNNKDGIPDIFQGSNMNIINQTSASIFYNGKTYNNIDDLPPEARQKYENAMSKLKAKGNSIPGMFEGFQQPPGPGQSSDNVINQSEPISPVTNSFIQPKKINPCQVMGWILTAIMFLVSLGLVILMIIER